MTQPNPAHYAFEPTHSITRADGSVLHAYRHRADPSRYRITVDGAPFDPADIVATGK